MTQTLQVPGDERFIFEVDPPIRYETYACEDYAGIMFWDEQGSKFDVVLNPHFGPRLIFNLRHGSWNDVPFKEPTFGFLPRGVRVRCVGAGDVAKEDRGGR